MAAERRRAELDGWPSPCCRRARAGPRSASPAWVGTRAPRGRVLRRAARAASWCSPRVRAARAASSPTCSCTSAASGAPTRARSSRSSPTARRSSRTRRRSARRSAAPPSCRSSSALIALVCAVHAQVADRGVRRVRPRRRVGDLPRDVAGRPARPPDVHRLEDLPVDASYPSGHTAASIAVYAGLVLLLTSAIPNRGLRFAAWVAAVVLPIFVAFSRMYRGMHHPLDVAGGVLVGIGAVLVLLFACRAAEAAVRAPARAAAPSRAAAACRRRHEGRGRRARREAARRRAAGAAPRARGGGRGATRSGTRCPRPSGRPTRCGVRWRRARTSCSPGAATAPSGAASASSPATEACLAVLPAGTANLFATQPRHPARTSRQAVAIGLRGERGGARRRPVRRRALRRDGRASASTPR